MNLDEALSAMFEGLREIDRGTEWQTPRQKDYMKRTATYPASYGRLRLDWELSDEALEDITSEEVYPLMKHAIQTDLQDLIENGDVNNVEDALYLTFDGEKKRGMKASNVEIVSAILYEHHSDVKKSVEYTLYLLLIVEFS